ncbi:MAG: MlaA family lipoprotein [Candidatus Loosdrechtia sp.]|uniref:MlaA family lipoprotein n=1 Tax=Candidatus Loosdrechtia sp. TaxID=3101272 RepID=UPI00403B093B
MQPLWRGRAAALLLAIAAAGLLGGCASTPRDPEGRDPYDPFEPLNRKVFAFNMAVDRAVLRPVARGYDAAVPRPVKSGVANFFDNLATPLWMLNHLLQGNLAEAGRQGGRFLLNSTGGVLGVFDVAGRGGIDRQRASFDQTLGKWGVPSGPYLMVPFIGPNTPRSGLGWYARYHTDIIWNYLDDHRSLRDKLIVLEIVDTRRRLLPLDGMIERAPDSYIFVREAYRQRVEFEIRGPGHPDDDIGLDFEDEIWDDDDEEW